MGHYVYVAVKDMCISFRIKNKAVHAWSGWYRQAICPIAVTAYGAELGGAAGFWDFLSVSWQVQAKPTLSDVFILVLVQDIGYIEIYTCVMMLVPCGRTLHLASLVWWGCRDHHAKKSSFHWFQRVQVGFSFHWFNKQNKTKQNSIKYSLRSRAQLCLLARPGTLT